MKIKKINLYLDNKSKQRFQESNISEDEMKKVEYGFVIQERINDGISYDKLNEEKKPYILLLKKINNIRNGNPNIFDRTIYFYEKDKEMAKKRIIYAFKEIMMGRNKESLQNLGFLTKENLNFITSLEEEKNNNNEVKKDGKKRNNRNND